MEEFKFKKIKKEVKKNIFELTVFASIGDGDGDLDETHVFENTYEEKLKLKLLMESFEIFFNNKINYSVEKVADVIEKIVDKYPVIEILGKKKGYTPEDRFEEYFYGFLLYDPLSDESVATSIEVVYYGEDGEEFLVTF